MKDIIINLLCRWFNLVTQKEHTRLKESFEFQRKEMYFLVHQDEFPMEAARIKGQAWLMENLERAYSSVKEN